MTPAMFKVAYDLRGLKLQLMGQEHHLHTIESVGMFCLAFGTAHALTRRRQHSPIANTGLQRATGDNMPLELSKVVGSIARSLTHASLISKRRQLPCRWSNCSLINTAAACTDNRHLYDDRRELNFPEKNCMHVRFSTINREVVASTSNIVNTTLIEPKARRRDEVEHLLCQSSSRELCDDDAERRWRPDCSGGNRRRGWGSTSGPPETVVPG